MVGSEDLSIDTSCSTIRRSARGEARLASRGETNLAGGLRKAPGEVPALGRAGPGSRGSWRGGWTSPCRVLRPRAPSVRLRPLVARYRLETVRGALAPWPGGTGPHLPSRAAPGPMPPGAPSAPELAACALRTSGCPPSSHCSLWRRRVSGRALRPASCRRPPAYPAFLVLSSRLSSQTTAAPERGARGAVWTPCSPFLSPPHHPVTARPVPNSAFCVPAPSFRRCCDSRPPVSCLRRCTRPATPLPLSSVGCGSGSVTPKHRSF